MKDNLSALRKTSAAFLILWVSCLTLLGQGMLPPPAGTPGPTMKSLDQLDTHVAQAGEKRIPIDAVHAPGDSANEFVITGSGSYYLTGDLVVAKTTGIQVKSDGATIDLNGFSIIRGSGTGGTGILIYGAGVTVKNGRIAGFVVGLLVGTLDPFGTLLARDGTVQHLTVSKCSDGLILGGGWRVEGCMAHDNQGNGIFAQDGAILTDCAAISNGMNGYALANGSVLKGCSAQQNSRAGFVGSSGTTIVNCTAKANKTDGISLTSNAIVTGCAALENGGISAGSGIVATNGAVISGCSVSSNAVSGIQVKNGCTISHCTAQGNAVDGIKAGENANLIACTSTLNGANAIGAGISTDIRATITGCSAIGNRADGIVFSGDSFVLNNHASTNGGAGFHDLGSNSRIEGNVSRENTGMGIQAAPADTVVRNNSGANGGLSYGPTAGPNWGPTATTANTSTSPWANF
jgi:hypothetical protein